jgi:uncharacterized protein with HEPN domain
VNYGDFDRIELILRLIGHLERRLSHLSEQGFLNDKDEIDLTAFRLSAVGEASYKLSGELKSRHPHIDWMAIYGMRNVIVHDYDAIRPEKLWEAATEKLNDLADICRVELDGTGH